MNMNGYCDCIIKIIAAKKWNSPGIIPKCFLNKAINLGKGFTDIERDFFIKMLEKFDIYPDPKYQDYLEEILNHINITEKKVYIAPLLSQVDKNNLYKSSHYIVRMFKSTYIKQLPLFDNKTVMLYQNRRNGLPEEAKQKADALMKQLKQAVTENDAQKVEKIDDALTALLFEF